MVRVNVDVDIEKMKQKLSTQNLKRGQYALANQILMDMNQFVPLKDAFLRNSATIGIDGSTINYNTPYARKQFYVQHSNYTTPGTGPRWDLKAKSMFMSSWEKAYIKGVGL